MEVLRDFDPQRDLPNLETTAELGIWKREESILCDQPPPYWCLLMNKAAWDEVDFF